MDSSFSFLTDNRGRGRREGTIPPALLHFFHLFALLSLTLWKPWYKGNMAVLHYTYTSAVCSQSIRIGPYSRHQNHNESHPLISLLISCFVFGFFSLKLEHPPLFLKYIFPLLKVYLLPQVQLKWVNTLCGASGNSWRIDSILPGSAFWELRA